MTTFWAKPIWDLLTPLQYLQFPWRFLTFTGLFAAVLAGYFIFLLKLPILKLIFSALLLILLIIPNMKLFRPQFFRQDLTDEQATSAETINWYVSHSSFEYAPRGVPIKTGDLGTNLIDIDKSQIPQEKITADPDKVALEIGEIAPHRFQFLARAREPSRLPINTFNFPGWRAKIDNQKTAIFDDNRYKLISIDLPQGEHKINVELQDTPVRKVGNYLSLFSAILLVMAIAFSKMAPSLFRAKKTPVLGSEMKRILSSGERTPAE
jgi:hypothetical protein